MDKVNQKRNKEEFPEEVEKLLKENLGEIDRGMLISLYRLQRKRAYNLYPLYQASLVFVASRCILQKRFETFLKLPFPVYLWNTRTYGSTIDFIEMYIDNLQAALSIYIQHVLPDSSTEQEEREIRRGLWKEVTSEALKTYLE